MTAGASDPIIGATLDGRYEVTQRLARGGMATVYLGTDLRLDRTVAIKVMHIGLGDDEEFAAKFDREARSAARLSHPNVVSVFDQGLGEIGGSGPRPYIVMEYVEGGTLRHLMRSTGALDPIQALTIMEAVLCALAAAHESGLVHRDIKPENVLIAERGSRIMVADFGLAKAITSQTATATAGVLIGTVSYLPPELVTQGRADARSDVYSAGVVLYEMVTGQKPHTGDTPIQVAYAHVHHDVPAPSAVRPELPDYLDALVRHATARRSADRPADARGLLRELRAVRAKLRAGCDGDGDLTEVIANGSATVGEWSAATGIRVRNTTVPHGYDPRTMVSPARSPLSPDGPVVHRGDHRRRVSGGGTTAVAERVRPPRRRTPTTPLSPHTPTDQQTPSGGWVPDEPRAHTAALRRRYRRRRGLVALVLVALLTAGAAVGSWWFVHTRTVATPSVTNLTVAQAVAAVEAAELGLGDSVEEFSETVPSGRIIDTRPAPGAEVAKGSVVELIISKGPDRTTAPELAGQPLAAAEKALVTARLATGAVTEEYHESIDDGVVISASTDDGASLRPGTAVDLVVSKGPRPIEITSWVGKAAADAEAALDEAGFAVTVTERYSDDVDAGDVISQQPRSGTGHRGDTITVVRSLGPELVVVPNVRSMGLEAAEAALKKAGFRTARKAVEGRDSLGLGYVSYTDPEAGTKARKGATVTMHYV